MAATNLRAVLSAFLSEVQGLENTVFDVIVSRLIGFAKGVQLDMLGRFVGENRLGRSDTDYRAAIRLKTYINGSSGRPEDLILIARAITGLSVVNYYDISPGNCRLVIPGWTPDDGSLHAFLQTICPAGVRLVDVTSGLTETLFRMGDRMGTRLVYYTE
jgi:hypothetical protein